MDLTGDDFPLGSLVGAAATSSVGSPSAAGRAADPDGVMVDQARPERTESPEQRKAKKGVNLRKSLAWDNAFFTSEGFLQIHGSSIYFVKLSSLFIDSCLLNCILLLLPGCQLT